MAKLDLDQAEFMFHSDALTNASLQVFHFTGRESLSQPFEFQIELICNDANLDLEAPLGQPATLTLRGRQYSGSRYLRIVHGVIERFVQLSAGIRHSRYQATLVPTIKQLHFTRNARIFQKLSSPEVTQAVLRDGKVPNDWINSMLHSTYGSRDYCVQYQESDLNFVQRLWEEEGIFYFFEHDMHKDLIALGDGHHAFDSLSHYSEINFYDQPHHYEEGISEFRAENALRSGATVLRDFKFKQPSLDMEAKAEGEKFTERKLYYFPGEYVDPALGQRLAKVRLEEQQCQRSRYVGSSNVRAMLPGYKFTLAGHRRRDCNQEYLIISVEHEGTQPQALGEEAAGVQKTAYQNCIACMPASVLFRPPRCAEAPRIPGVQTAMVVGPPGEEIHCDEHGRVKVQFHWDREGERNDNSSCWVRVSQPWGGMGQGGMFIPRIGQEVVVQFLEGDPDRPLIIGRVYNGENPVPHGLPAAKNISTIRSCSTPGGGGFNELKFNDTAGSEEVFFHSQFNRNDVTLHDQTLNVGNNQTNTVGVDRTRQVGHNEKISVGNDRTRQVGNNEQLTVGNDRTRQVGNNEQITIGTNRTLAVGANENTNIGSNQTLQVGANQSTTVGGMQELTVAKVQNVSVALAAMESIGLGKALNVGLAYAVNVGTIMNTVVGAAAIKKVGKIAMETVGLLKKITAGKKLQMVSGATQVVLANAGSKVTVQAGTSKIEMKPGSLKLDSGAGATVELEGSKIKLSAAQIEIKGAGQVNVQSGGVTTVKGSLVKINC